MKPNLLATQFPPTYRFHQLFTNSFFPIQIKKTMSWNISGNPVTRKEQDEERKKNSVVNNDTAYLEENDLSTISEIFEKILYSLNKKKMLWEKRNPEGTISRKKDEDKFK